jgi:hypothetical protein
MMNKLPIAAALFCATASYHTQAVDEPGSLDVGIFEVIPELALDQRYDDNVFSQAEDEVHSWVTVVAPSIQAQADLGSVAIDLEFQHLSGIYDRTNADNYHDNYVSTTLGWELNHRNQLDLTASYNDSHEDRGTGFSQGTAILEIDEPDTFEEVTFDAKYTYGSESSRGRLVLNVTNYEKEFTNHRDSTRGRDRDDITGATTFYWRVGGRTNVLAELKKTDVDYVNDPADLVDTFDSLDSDLTKYLVGVTWEATAKTEGSIKVGQAKKDFDDSDREDFSDSSWEVDIQWAPKTYSIFSLNSAREARETNGIGSFIDAKTYGVAWQHGWSSRLSSSLFFNYEEETYKEDADGRKDELAAFGVRIDYSMRRWLGLGLTVGYADKDSNIDTFDYSRNQVTFHLLMNL